MSRIHITLVGGQPAPIYNGIMATQPDRVVYIYSEGSKSVLDKLRSVLQLEADERSLDPTDPLKIKQLAEQLAEKYKKDEVTVNITSGLKSWSYFFGIVFDKQPNAAVVYIDQNNVLWNYKTMTGSTDFTFDMHTAFLLYGNPIENNYKKYESYTEADYKAMKKVENIRGFNYNDFNSLLTVLDNKRHNVVRNQSRGKFELPTGSYVEWEKTTVEKDGFVRICLSKKNGEKAETCFESPNAVDIAFNSGWFEYKIATILAQWNKAKELCLNCRFPYKKGIDKNEVDIIVNTGSKILFVECKTQINNTTDIDKFRSVVKGYGGMGSKGLFITDTPMTDVAKEKCKEHNILSFSLQGSHLGMSTEQALFLLLDTELYNINAK